MENSIANPQVPEQDPEVKFRKGLGKLTRWYRLMSEAGLNIEDLQADIDDPERRGRHLAFIKCGCYEPTTDQRLAREIMGEHYFGVEEAVQHFGVSPKKVHLTALAKIPISEAELRECRSTHLLVATFSLSILEIRAKVEHGLFHSYEDTWYNGESFAKQRCEVAWHLVRKTPVPNSTRKTWEEQQALLAENEETPSACVMVYTIIGHCLATGDRLFPSHWIRCSDLDSGGSRVFVGDFGSYGLSVGYYWVDHRYVSLGLASARKS